MRYETYLVMGDHELLAYMAWTLDCVFVTGLALVILVSILILSRLK